MLQEIIAHPAFRSGDTTTDFIKKYLKTCQPERGGKPMSEIASMAGSVWKVLVKAGDHVEAGQDVVILESMKMEIPIAAESDGTVEEVKVNEGDFVNEGDILIEVE